MSNRINIILPKEQSVKDEGTVIASKAIAPSVEEVDIDLNDPEVETAALKIQAGFKGMKTRRELKTKKVL